jgi:leucyl-tRNA synthetase
MMELTNHLTKLSARPKSALKTLTLLLAPFAPHLAEELWQALGGKATLAYEPWPKFDEAKLKSATVEIPVQVNGKVRAKIAVAVDLPQDALIKAAQEHPALASHLAGKTIKKAVAVPNKMVSFAVA